MSVKCILNGMDNGTDWDIQNEFGSHLIMTHMDFLDWFIGYYTHEMDHHPGRYIIFW